MDRNVETERLIASLGQGLSAVKPLRPPQWRALLWLTPLALLVLLAVWRYANLGAMALRVAEPRVALECLGALLTGVVAIVSAFYLSLPDRSDWWRWAPLPPLALWLACSGIGCLENGLGLGPAGARLGESGSCFKFIVIVSVPAAALLFIVLRRARPLQPLRVALCGALGVAALAAFVLQFFHPFDVTVIDLAMHALAVVVVVGIAALLRRTALSPAG
jgi:hypothetical protein